MIADDAHTQAKVADDWFVDAFGVLYPIIYAHRTAQVAAPEARFAAQRIGLQHDECALDLCCGAGRHLVTLTTLVRQIAGVDYSSALLAIARGVLSEEVPLVRADMRALPFHACFDVVFNFFTSFGYFMDDADNAKTAHTLARVLKPRGRLFMDYLNPQAVRRQLRPASERESQGYIIQERRWIDAATRRVNKRTSVLRSGVCIGTTSESVRLYELQELTALLAQYGLRVDQVYGDYEGGAYGPDSARMLLVCVKGES